MQNKGKKNRDRYAVTQTFTMQQINFQDLYFFSTESGLCPDCNEVHRNIDFGQGTRLANGWNFIPALSQENSIKSEKKR